ncbi:hypothetical protein KWR21_017785 [Clostridioides difficile]|uniref:hypothetical protein n=1 Tax=Clostridioides difficile TaxID=1496 RepID=UPI0018EE3695|nr:hypothetical protein [Clostridioides difficile]MBY1673564.1 hypothetical protein [Clostridioides difficile]MBY1795680.1 hypothetical protein [Clostridioides difficile]MBY1999382.1 hypothetical protein [Clostridioides difficile]MCA0506456.1 hypothetical protein [Clostridioides difficile]MCA0743488.1 hypothetical protein [Clostridioides difficile]
MKLIMKTREQIPRDTQVLNTDNFEASVHYYMDDKVVYQTLVHKDGAWSVGKIY